MNKKNNDGKGISLVLVGILTIVIAIAGSTFAFFNVTASNTTKISGSSAYSASSLTLTVDLLYPTSNDASKQLIPQLGTAINTATNPDNECVDGNGNAVCRVYKIEVSNKTSMPYYVTTKLNLTVPSTMEHLKWASSTSPNSGYNTTGYDSSKTDIISPSNTGNLQTTLLSAQGTSGATATYYVVFWIQETGSAQTDSGTFNASVEVNGYSSSTASSANQGITSTITANSS